MLNVDKARLENAPGFDPGAWPDMSDVNRARQIHTFYGTDPQSSIPTMGPSTAMGGMVSGGATGVCLPLHGFPHFLQSFCRNWHRRT